MSIKTLASALQQCYWGVAVWKGERTLYCSKLGARLEKKNIKIEITIKKVVQLSTRLIAKDDRQDALTLGQSVKSNLLILLRDTCLLWS